MNTPTHLIFGAAVFGKPGAPIITACALAGAFMPDMSLYLMAGWHLFILETPARVVFDQLYFSDSWQMVFAIDNSFILWGLLLGLALWLRAGWLIAFSGAALLHLAFDFPLHHDDARRHFWPVSDWVFVSPFSYWDRSHHGSTIATLEIVASLLALAYLWRKFSAKVARAAIAVATLIQLAPGLIWIFIFNG